MCHAGLSGLSWRLKAEHGEAVQLMAIEALEKFLHSGNTKKG